MRDFDATYDFLQILPPSLAQEMPLLSVFIARNSGLTGNIPAEYALWAERMLVFDVSGNFLTGSIIFDELRNCKKYKNY